MCIYQDVTNPDFSVRIKVKPRHYYYEITGIDGRVIGRVPVEHGEKSRLIDPQGKVIGKVEFKYEE
jgi:hypothetical protein